MAPVSGFSRPPSFDTIEVTACEGAPEICVVSWRCCRGAPGYNEIRKALKPGAAPLVLGPGGTAAACLIGAVATDPASGAHPVLVIAPTLDAAERLTDDLRTLLSGTDLHLVLYPDAQTASPPPRLGAGADPPADPAADAAAASARLEVLNALMAGGSVVVVASTAAAIDPLPTPAALGAGTRVLQTHQTLPRDRLVADLQA